MHNEIFEQFQKGEIIGESDCYAKKEKNSWLWFLSSED
jgi:hypothetical protein